MANLSDKIIPSTINSAVTLANSAVQLGDNLDAGDLINALPAIDGSALTSLNSSSLSGALPAIDGSNLTGVASLTLVTAVNTTSGTAIDFTGIPAGTNRITINFSNVRQSLSTPLLIQLGDSGGVETSGYVASSSHSSGDNAATTGFNITRTVTSNVTHGIMTLTRVTGNQWASSHATTRNTAGSTASGGGSKTLTGELTQVRLTTTTGGTFNLGIVSISYE
jgi:hypothetical protein